MFKHKAIPMKFETPKFCQCSFAVSVTSIFSQISFIVSGVGQLIYTK